LRRRVSFLEQILSSRREAVSQLRGSSPADGPPVRDFRGSLAAGGMSVIAEIKRASPSKGDLDPSLDPVEVARAYERGGARALSVLTEPQFFKGSPEDLVAARSATTLPVLWKDFLIDPVQVSHARSFGADAVLLIVRIVSDEMLQTLLSDIGDRSMCALVEVFDERDLERALTAGADVIGVNHRDLETFEDDTTATKRLRPLVPEDVVLVAESAIATRADVEELEAIGVDAILVGEALVRSADRATKIRELLGVQDAPPGAPSE
jgi:indole-3-glycerol phosphate synthase